MQDWKNYVGYQQPDTSRSEFLMMVDRGDNHIIYLTLDVKDVVCSLTEDQVGTEVERLLLMFPNYVDGDATQPFNVRRVANAVARRARRGVGNTRWNDVLFYKGPLSADCPIAVVEFDGKFAVCTNPNFDLYGFVMSLAHRQCTQDNTIRY